MIEVIKSLISSRGVQLLARGAAIGLTWLAAKAQVTLDATQAESASNVIALIAAGGVCILIDFVSHKLQKDDTK
jgi:hypothetical protein